MQAQPDLSGVPGLRDILQSLKINPDELKFSIGPSSGASLGVARSYPINLGSLFDGGCHLTGLRCLPAPGPDSPPSQPLSSPHHHRHVVSFCWLMSS